MLKDFFTIKCNNRKTTLLFFLFLFQMLGIRLFQGWGAILTFCIFLLLVTNVRLTLNRITSPLVLGGAAAVFQMIKGSSLNYCVLVAFYIIDACLMIYYTEKKNVKKDFVAALQIYLIQALLSIIMYIIVPKSLMWVPQTGGTHSLTFLYIFYYMPDKFLFVPRLSGWAWEPGCMQMLINLYLTFLVIDKARIKSLIIPSILLFYTGSTAGFVIYVIIIGVYIFRMGARKFISYLPILLIAIALMIPYMWSNVSQKLSIGGDGGVNTSGAMRIRDLLVGIEEVKQYPLFGIDMSDLANSREYQNLEDTALGKMSNVDSTWHTYFDYAAGGYNNGFFCMHMLWGVFGIYLFITFIKCKLWNKWCPDKYHLMIPAIILLTMMSSPLSNTALFLYFSLYNMIAQKKDAYINSYSYV